MDGATAPPGSMAVGYNPPNNRRTEPLPSFWVSSVCGTQVPGCTKLVQPYVTLRCAELFSPVLKGAYSSPCAMQGFAHRALRTRLLIVAGSLVASTAHRVVLISRVGRYSNWPSLFSFFLVCAIHWLARSPLLPGLQPVTGGAAKQSNSSPRGSLQAAPLPFYRRIC